MPKLRFNYDSPSRKILFTDDLNGKKEHHFLTNFILEQSNDIKLKYNFLIDNYYKFKTTLDSYADIMNISAGPLMMYLKSNFRSIMNIGDMDTHSLIDLDPVYIDKMVTFFRKRGFFNIMSEFLIRSQTAVGKKTSVIFPVGSGSMYYYISTMDPFNMASFDSMKLEDFENNEGAIKMHLDNENTSVKKYIVNGHTLSYYDNFSMEIMDTVTMERTYELVEYTP